MARYLYSASIEDFLLRADEEIVGILNIAGRMTVEFTQQDAWGEQIRVLKSQLQPYKRGTLFFEYAVPRLGKRIDVIIIVDHVLFVLEFKVGDSSFKASAVEQVWDYALDLKNFHETSHQITIAPVLIATKSPDSDFAIEFSKREDGVLKPIAIGSRQLSAVIAEVVTATNSLVVSATTWQEGRYKPTPTIIEAAAALYNEHSVEEIARKGAEDKNLFETSDAILCVIDDAKKNRKKAICFVTGVPGAGKTLVGLDIATTKFADDSTRAVYLSGNGPLVKVLCEALAMDRVRTKKQQGERLSKSEARRAVKLFIQNVHHFRDAYLSDKTAPDDHIAVFDEAQRAWDVAATAKFMKAKRGLADFEMSEPQFLISCMDRHKDWAVIVCLVGDGQEINRGEAGISEWISAVNTTFPHWDVHISPELDLTKDVFPEVKRRKGISKVFEDQALHLSVSMRSFRAQNVSSLVKSILDMDLAAAQKHLLEIDGRFPIVLTRSVATAKEWVKSQARGSERYGVMVSSQAQRLKPHAIDVRVAVDPVHWFLKGKDDTRSSFYLEDVATEFDVQGLELDWGCVVWDGDFRRAPSGWQHSSFKGFRWERIKKPERQVFQKNAYRVLLTRARQGMVIVVPEGDSGDLTRLPSLYDPTFKYLASVGFECI